MYCIAALAIVEKQLVVCTFCKNCEGPLLAIILTNLLKTKGRQHTGECVICSSHTLLAILQPTNCGTRRNSIHLHILKYFPCFPTQTLWVKDPTPRVSWLITTHLGVQPKPPRDCRFQLCQLVERSMGSKSLTQISAIWLPGYSYLSFLQSIMA